MACCFPLEGSFLTGLIDVQGAGLVAQQIQSKLKDAEYPEDREKQHGPVAHSRRQTH
jgi:hypothetical protein